METCNASVAGPARAWRRPLAQASLCYKFLEFFAGHAEASLQAGRSDRWLSLQPYELFYGDDLRQPAQQRATVGYVRQGPQPSGSWPHLRTRTRRWCGSGAVRRLVRRSCACL